MNLRSIAILAFAFCLFHGAGALAAPLDNAANKKIDEAINTHYLGTNFKKAVGVLEGTVEACGEKCSNAVLARAYMYLGIVKGAGMQDLAGAEVAFATALSLDPNVKLDKDLATDELIELFENSGGDATVGAVAPAGPADPPPGLTAGDGEMTCTPDISEIQVRRPMPVACRVSKPATKVVVYYKEFGAPSYSQVPMTLSGSDWLASVPCSATSIQGELKWFVSASGSGGVVDTYGSEAEPNVVQVVQSTEEPAPAHPGKPAPEACADAADCPEEMRGTPSCPDVAKPSTRGDKGWGAGCEKHQECEQGLYCLNGSCESPPSCETGADCKSGICEDFLCVISEDEEEGGGGGASGGSPSNFVGVWFGADFTSLSGEYVCNPNPLLPTPGSVDGAGLELGTPAASATGFSCFVGEQPYATHPYADNLESGSIPSSLAPGTFRVYLSYERIFAEKFGAEVQVGLGLNGAPNTALSSLLHAAAFGKYWFMGTGEGLKLYGAVGGGLGQVDANKTVAVIERDPADPWAQTVDPNGQNAIRDFWRNTYCDPATATTARCDITPIQSYKSFGQGFVGAGLGAMLNLGPVAFDLRLLGKFMLPATGVVIQPTLGALIPF